MKALLIVLGFMLSACTSDDTQTNAEVENKPLQLSFSSKPTDEQVLSFLKKPGRFDIKLADNAGKNSTYELRKRWQKGFSYKTNAKIEAYPDAILQVGGFVQFQINGQNYDFDAVKPLTTQILGLQPPKESVLLDLIQKSMKMFYPNYHNIVYQEPIIKLAASQAEQNIFWYSPLSFSANFSMDFSEKAGSNRIEKKHCIKGVRFYRDEINLPFNRLIPTKTKCTTIETKQLSYAEFDKIASIESLKAEKSAQQEFAALPKINLPDFNDEKEALRWVYQFLLTANDKSEVKSLLMHMLTADAFIQGSNSQFNANGIRILNDVTFALFEGKVTFKESHCPQIFIKKYSPGYLQFYDALKQTHSRLSISKSGGQLVKGKMINQSYKITTIDLSNPNSKTDIANLRSWPLDELCEDTAKKIKIF